MEEIIAPAKINLTFYITGKLDSGYHTIDSIMQGISLCDKIILTKTRKKGIRVECSSLDCNEEDNLAYIAGGLISREYKDKIKQGTKIEVYKKIPSAAGLGGGSSDAAAVIKGMNRLYGLGMDDEEMIQIAAKIGMDVPFFILGGTVHATRQGQKVKRINDIPNNIYFVLAKPNFSISTKEAYEEFDKYKDKSVITKDMLEEINRYMLNAINSEDVELISSLILINLSKSL